MGIPPGYPQLASFEIEEIILTLIEIGIPFFVIAFINGLNCVYAMGGPGKDLVHESCTSSWAFMGSVSAGGF